MVKVAPLAVPQLAPRASSARAWRLWGSSVLPERGPATERPATASGAHASGHKVADFTACIRLGALLVSAGHAGRVALWVVDSSLVRWGTISPLRDLRSSSGRIGSLAIHSNRLVTAGERGQIQLWEHPLPRRHRHTPVGLARYVGFAGEPPPPLPPPPPRTVQVGIV